MLIVIPAGMLLLKNNLFQPFVLTVAPSVIGVNVTALDKSLGFVVSLNAILPYIMLSYISNKVTEIVPVLVEPYCPAAMVNTL